jgi:hypothetical protein
MVGFGKPFPRFLRRGIYFVLPQMRKGKCRPDTSCEACGNDLQGIFHPHRPKTCGLAWWSLYLGLASIILSILTAIPAIICGHIALSRIKKSQDSLTGRGMAIAGTILGYIFIFFVIFAIPAFLRVRELVRIAVCLDNLHDIGCACNQYAAYNGGMFPDKLSRLYPRYIVRKEQFLCPSDNERLTRDLSTPEGIDRNTSYIYIPGLKGEDGPDQIMAFDKPENHQHKGRCVMHIDASVNWEWLK